MPNQRYYGPQHRRLRERAAPQVEAGLVDCWRCGEPIQPGAPWDLGHDDNNPKLYRGPEHPRCNRATSEKPRRDPEPVPRTRW